MIQSEFISRKNIVAVVGASNNKNKWGYKIYKKLRLLGFSVYPVNPNHETIDRKKCYPDLKVLPKKPDVVITVVPPKITEKVVKECKNIGIEKIWMQPGSESKKAIEFCKKNDIDVIYNACFVINGLKEVFE